MLKDKRQGIVLLSLGGILVIAIGLQVGGGNTQQAAAVQQKAAFAAPVLSRDNEEAQTISRDVFWHPSLVKTEDTIPVVAANQPIATGAAYPKITGNLPLPKIEGYLPVLPDVSAVESSKGHNAKLVAQPSPAQPKPKKQIVVCGFISSSSPKVILSIDGGEPQVFESGERPLPNLKVGVLGKDSATFLVAGRKVSIALGQEFGL